MAILSFLGQLEASAFSDHRLLYWNHSYPHCWRLKPPTQIFPELGPSYHQKVMVSALEDLGLLPGFQLDRQQQWHRLPWSGCGTWPLRHQRLLHLSLFAGGGMMSSGRSRIWACGPKTTTPTPGTGDQLSVLLPMGFWLPATSCWWHHCTTYYLRWVST